VVVVTGATTTGTSGALPLKPERSLAKRIKVLYPPRMAPATAGGGEQVCVSECVLAMVWESWLMGGFWRKEEKDNIVSAVSRTIQKRWNLEFSQYSRTLPIFWKVLPNGLVNARPLGFGPMSTCHGALLRNSSGMTGCRAEGRASRCEHCGYWLRNKSKQNRVLVACVGNVVHYVGLYCCCQVWSDTIYSYCYDTGAQDSLRWFLSFCLILNVGGAVHGRTDSNILQNVVLQYYCTGGIPVFMTRRCTASYRHLSTGALQ
jgi:hypothetical protein